MAITTDPGVYMLYNKVSGAYYVGAAKKGRKRVLGQLRSLIVELHRNLTRDLH